MLGGAIIIFSNQMISQKLATNQTSIENQTYPIHFTLGCNGYENQTIVCNNEDPYLYLKAEKTGFQIELAKK